MSEAIDQPLRVAILGAGDVVIHRLLPALSRARSRWPIGPITLHDIGMGAPLPETSGARLMGHPTSLSAAEAAAEADLVFICTPPDQHVFYVDFFLDRHTHVVCEKPISSSREEIFSLDRFVGRQDRLFCLSYYTLEKAAPYSYFLHQWPELSDCMSGAIASRTGGSRTINPAALDGVIAEYRSRLGALTGARAWLLEGTERSSSATVRRWALDPGMLLFETGIHGLLLVEAAGAVLGAGRRGDGWRWHVAGRGTAVESAVAGAATCLRLEGEWSPGAAAGPRAELVVGKYIPHHRTGRFLSVAAAGGTLHADLDRRRVRVSLTDHPDAVLELSLADGYEGKYDLQVELVCRWRLRPDARSGRDGVREQAGVLRWLAANAVAMEQGPMVTCEADAPSPILDRLLGLPGTAAGGD